MALRAKCTEFFHKMLLDFGCTVDEDGTIRHFERTPKGGVKHPKVKISGLDLVLPYKEQLAKPEGDNVVFAPLNENALAGESAVITTLKKIGNTNLQYRLAVILTTIATLLTNNTTVKGKLLKVIKAVPELTPATKKELIKLLSRASKVPINRNLIGMYLTHKNQTFEGRPVKRLCTVTSPLLDALGEEGDAWGVKMAKKHKEAVIALINAVLPDLNDDLYTTGSSNHSAPYFDTLGQSFGKVSTRLGYIEDLLRPYQDAQMVAELPAPVTGDWIETMEDFSAIAKAFPPLAGNNGNVPTGKEVAAHTNLSNVKLDEANSTTANSGFGDAPAKTTAKPENGVDEWDAPSTNVPQVNQSGAFGAPTNNGFAAPATGGFGAPTQPQSGFGEAPQSGFGQPTQQPVDEW